MARNILIVLLVAVFSLSLQSAVISGEMGKGVKGTVSKIEGNVVTIRDATCSEQAIQPQNSRELASFRVGDRVSFKDGALTKARGGDSAMPYPGEKC